MTRHERLRAFLDSMGQTSDEVAAFMRKHKIQGQRHAACDCPVARALKRKFRGLNSTVSYHTSGDGYSALIRTPPPVAVFILRFDAGLYPDLEQ